MEKKKIVVCENCICWNYLEGTERGLCRRRAPSPEIMEPEKEFTLVIPSTHKEDGCFDGIPRS